MPTKPNPLQYYTITLDDSENNYRYLLSELSKNRNNGESVAVILMNPSVADL